MDSTPLFAACGNIEAVQLLLGRGADANAKSTLCTLISWACFCSRNIGPHTVRLLLDGGAKKLEAPAHCAGDMTVLKQILESDPSSLESRNNKGQRACSIRHPAWRYCSFLLDQGLGVNARDNNGYTPLHALVDKSGMETETIQLLLVHGANANAAGTKDLKAPLHIVCQRLNSPVARLLLDNGAKINAQDSHGNTPLHTACAHYEKTFHISFVELLIDRGANMEITNDNEQTPLHIGCFGKRKDNFLRLMLQRGANANDFIWRRANAP